MSSIARRRAPVSGRSFFAVCLVATTSFAWCRPDGARAAVGSAVVSGVVTADGKPVADAAVSADGNDVVVRTRTDAQGRFAFPALRLGAYVVRAVSPGGTASAKLELNGEGAVLALTIAGLKEIGSVNSVRASARLRGGTDVSLDATILKRLPTNGNFAESLIQLPGAVRGANGVVHLNGDHGVINYLVDGVPLPQALNRQIGSEIDPNDISYVDVIEGAFPAQYGLRFGSTLNISTRAGSGPAGFDGSLRAGSYTTGDATLGYHAPIGHGGGLDVAVRNERGTRGLDPPNFSSPHNAFSNTNQFLRLSVPNGRDFADLSLIHSYRSFQIPNDVENGQPAPTDDGERQEDTFVNLQYRHLLGATGELSFGPALKISRIRDSGDAANDFSYGQALNAANGGARTDCANALTSGSYVASNCAFSLNADKTATDYILQSDYVQRFGRHEIRAGVSYDYADVGKRYAVTLQPNNFLAPTLTPSTPGAPTTVVDDNTNSGNTYQSYIQDGIRIGNRLHVDAGLRYDFFKISSVDIDQGFGSFSPRLKITQTVGPRSSVYAYVGRFFEPFSLENVSPRAAQQLNLPLQPALAQFDVKPERDTQIELGGHLPLAGGSLGLRVWQKNANDLIDDTQVGTTLLHQDINYTLGRLSQEAAYYEHALPRNGRTYLSVAHTASFNKGCETQLLAPCFGSSTDFTPADHDQSYSVSGGILANDRRNGWFSLDGEYGSGLSSASCPAGVKGFCKRTPHLTFNVEKGIALAKDTALTLEVDNLLNDRYFVTLLNAQGNHYAPPRLFTLGIRYGR